jgi:hypothetical protein
MVLYRVINKRSLPQPCFVNADMRIKNEAIIR